MLVTTTSHLFLKINQMAIAHCISLSYHNLSLNIFSFDIFGFKPRISAKDEPLKFSDKRGGNKLGFYNKLLFDLRL